MEVDAGRSGEGSVTAEASPRSRTRLNAALWAIAVLCAAGVVWLSTVMVDQHRQDGGDTSGGFLSDAASVITDRRAEGVVAAGTTIGSAEVLPLTAASEEEQLRDGAILDAAAKMANAFVNLRYDDADAAVETVKSLATGDFRDQYEKSAEGLVKIAKRAESVMQGDVLWTGLVASDDDSGTVIAATAGTVANKTTDFKPQARNYRLQLELVLADGRWLVRDLQFVA